MVPFPVVLLHALGQHCVFVAVIHQHKPRPGCVGAGVDDGEAVVVGVFNGGGFQKIRRLFQGDQLHDASSIVMMGA